MNIHEKYIQRCLTLAKNGLGSTYPNPMVGCVLVSGGKIIGEGWHQRAGEAHAEVRAIDSVKDQSLLAAATLYVNLEPCSHTGKTPPCAHLIAEKGIQKVVIGMLDPNVKVHGKGVAYLQEKGCDVTVGILETACQELNKRFITFHTKHRPYVFLKWAETADGFIDPFRVAGAAKTPHWISSAYAQQRSHQLRAYEQAILVGTHTVTNDNPSLTTRAWYGSHPLRLVLDRQLKIPPEAAVFNDLAPTLVFHSLSDHTETGGEHAVDYIRIDFEKDLPAQVLHVLHQRNVQSVIIEGGAQTLQGFIDAGLWDEALVFVSKGKVFSAGLRGPELAVEPVEHSPVDTDMLYRYRKNS